MPANKRRGRPRTYDYEERRRLAGLIRHHAARRTIEISGARICLETLKIARECGIELKTGRRPRDLPMKRLRSTPTKLAQVIEDNQQVG